MDATRQEREELARKLDLRSAGGIAMAELRLSDDPVERKLLIAVEEARRGSDELWQEVEEYGNPADLSEENLMLQERISDLEEQVVRLEDEAAALHSRG